jgi:hypothetical protein
MKKAKALTSAVLVAAFALATVACGGWMSQVQQSAKDTQHLQFISQMYQTYLTTKKKPPSGPDDLSSLANLQQEKDAVQAVKDGNIIVNWNIDLNDNSQFPQGKSNYIIAYAKTPLSDQRFVMTADGMVVNIPETDFQTKSKNKPGKK